MSMLSFGQLDDSTLQVAVFNIQNGLSTPESQMPLGGDIPVDERAQYDRLSPTCCFALLVAIQYAIRTRFVRHKHDSSNDGYTDGEG